MKTITAPVALPSLDLSQLVTVTGGQASWTAPKTTPWSQWNAGATGGTTGSAAGWSNWSK